MEGEDVLPSREHQKMWKWISFLTKIWCYRLEKMKNKDYIDRKYNFCYYYFFFFSNSEWIVLDVSSRLCCRVRFCNFSDTDLYFSSEHWNLICCEIVDTAQRDKTTPPPGVMIHFIWGLRQIDVVPIVHAPNGLVSRLYVSLNTIKMNVSAVLVRTYCHSAVTYVMNMQRIADTKAVIKYTGGVFDVIEVYVQLWVMFFVILFPHTVLTR